MKPSFALVLPLLLMRLISAQVAHWGPCPEPAVQPAFSMKKLSLPCLTCTKVSISIVKRVLYRHNLKGRSARKKPLLQNRHKKILPYSPYWIISTDYENSALVYSCTDVLRLFHMDIAWILGRTPREIFTSSNIDVSRMVTSRQQGGGGGLL
uniref:Apolipoprotein D n=1 Tax=Salmo trutta TaxID=8032 RepID=A0A674E5I5_SALTR